MPEISSPHAPSHEDGGNDEIDLSGLSGQQIRVPYNGKLADITHADTNKHTLDLATALSETREIIGGVFCTIRTAGSGVFYFYPNEGTTSVYQALNNVSHLVIIADGTNRIQYSLQNAGEQFGLYCFGYVVEA